LQSEEKDAITRLLGEKNEKENEPEVFKKWCATALHDLGK